MSSEWESHLLASLVGTPAHTPKCGLACVTHPSMGADQVSLCVQSTSSSGLALIFLCHDRGTEKGLVFLCLCLVFFMEASTEPGGILVTSRYVGLQRK